MLYFQLNFSWEIIDMKALSEDSRLTNLKLES